LGKFPNWAANPAKIIAVHCLLSIRRLPKKAKRIAFFGNAVFGLQLDLVDEPKFNDVVPPSSSVMPLAQSKRNGRRV